MANKTNFIMAQYEKAVLIWTDEMLKHNKYGDAIFSPFYEFELEEYGYDNTIYSRVSKLRKKYFGNSDIVSPRVQHFKLYIRHHNYKAQHIKKPNGYDEWKQNSIEKKKRKQLQKETFENSSNHLKFDKKQKPYHMEKLKKNSILENENVKQKKTEVKIAKPKKYTLKIKKKTSNNVVDISQETWNHIDKVEIFDLDTSAIFGMATTAENNNVLINKRGVEVGEYRDWEDIHNEIPDNYKDEDNCVVGEDGLPMIEYELYEKGLFYHSLRAKKYTEFRYCPHRDEFIDTQTIKLL